MQQLQDDNLPYRRKETSVDGPESAQPDNRPADAAERPRLESLEERLAAGKWERRLGDVVARNRTEEAPVRLDVEASRDEVLVEHIPVNRIVNDREEPRQEGDALVVPIYEEQVVMVKRLVLKEYVRVQRTRVTERQVYAETVRRDRLVIEDPASAGPIREVFRGPGGEDQAEPTPSAAGGVVEWLKRALFS